MKITKTTTIQEIFDQFNTVFPYLKLEFYSKNHAQNEGSSADSLINHQTMVGTINPKLEDADFDLDGEKTVTEFEKMMKNLFNLNIQVFRKSSDLWLQTTSTDHWTLNKQNGKGQRSIVDYNIEPVDITDFDVD